MPRYYANTSRSINAAIPTSDGRHPKYRHLVMFEADPHHGSAIVTAREAAPGRSALWSWEDWQHAVGDEEQAELEFAYLSEEYLDVLGPDDADGD